MDERQHRMLNLLPDKPDEAFDAWVMRKPQMQRNVIVYKMAYVPDIYGGGKQKIVCCNCSACGMRFYQRVTYNPIATAFNAKKQVDFGWLDDNNNPIGNEDSCKCPCCDADAISLHVGKVASSGRTIGYCFPMQIMTLDGVPALVCWRYRKTTDKSAKVSIFRDKYEAYAFFGKKCFRYTGYDPGFMGSKIPTGFWQTRTVCVDGIMRQDKQEIYPFRRDVFRGTALENAKFKEYVTDSGKSCFPVTYLRTFQRHKQVENLVVQGAAELVTQIINANRRYYGYGYYANERIVVPEHGINWKAKKPASMLDLNREEFAAFRKHEWSLDLLEAYKKIRAAGYTVDVFEYQAENKPIRLDQALVLAKKGFDPEKVCRYLDKQNRKHQPPEDCDGTMLLDYWDMAKRERVKLETERDQFPPDLYGAHEQMVELQRIREEERTRKYRENLAKKQEKDAEQYGTSFAALAARYADFAFAEADLCIHIAAEPKELIQEGLKLHHCVGNYVRSHSEGNRCIFFLRKTNAPDEPYYTLELDMRTLKVLQNRCYKNGERTPEVIAFEKQWLKYIKEIAKQKERKTA